MVASVYGRACGVPRGDKEVCRGNEVDEVGFDGDGEGDVMGFKVDDKWMDEMVAKGLIDPEQLESTPLAGQEVYPLSFYIPNFRPVRLNQLMYQHWTKVRKLKKADHKTIGNAFRQSGLPGAKVRRRVSVHIKLKPRAKQSDDDAIQKVLLDGLVECGALVDDNRAYVEMGKITYERGTAEDWGTTITLEDIPQHKENIEKRHEK